MKIFDAQIRSDTRTDDELRNLHYFETDRVVTTAHDLRPFERADDLLGYFEDLVTTEVARLRRCGLTGHVALGVLPGAQPRRAHYEVWREMPFALQDRAVIAVGEIGAWEDSTPQWELFDRQVKMALEQELPVIVTPGPELPINMTYKMMTRLESLGMAPGHCLMNRLDHKLLATVVAEGFIGGVAVGYRNMEPRQAATSISETLMAEEDARHRIVLNSSLRRGAADILGVPKTIVALGEAGVSDPIIERLARGNALELFGLTSDG